MAFTLESILGMDAQKQRGLALRVRSNAVGLSYHYGKKILKKYNNLGEKKSGIREDGIT